MPINSSHAYARGIIFKENKPSHLFRYFNRFIKWLEYQQGQIVWETFKKNSLLGSECNLGPNAWCINFGRQEDIKLGNRIYCRGILRCGIRGRGRIIIGDEVYIGDDSIINSENYIEIGNLTMISHGVQIHDSIGHPTDPALREKDWKIVMGEIKGPRPEADGSPIIIGKRVWIGFNSILMRGVTIEDNAIIASGSVVVDDVASNTIVAGNPAKVVKNVIF
jgi:acetyltransferase-like isoleucine patch superfamily enzyme